MIWDIYFQFTKIIKTAKKVRFSYRKINKILVIYKYHYILYLFIIYRLNPMNTKI